MTLLIGLDIGWSYRRRSCGVALQGADLLVPPRVIRRNYLPQVNAAALYATEVVSSILPAVVGALANQQRVLIVTDAIVGPNSQPIEERYIDRTCSKGGFYI